MKTSVSVALVTMLCAGATVITLLGPTLWPPIVEPPPVLTTPTERAFGLLKCYGVGSSSFGDPSLDIGVFPSPEEAARGMLESPKYFFTTGPFEPATMLRLDSSYGPNAYQALNENGFVVAVVWVESVPGEPERFTAGESVSCVDPTITEPYEEPAGYSTTAIGVPWWGLAIWGPLVVGATAAWIGLLRRGAVTSPAGGGSGPASAKAEPALERVRAAHRHLRAQEVMLLTLAVVFGLCWAVWQYSGEVLIGPDGKALEPVEWIMRGPLVGHVVVEDHNVNVVTLLPLLVPLITWLWVLDGRPTPSRKGRTYAQRLKAVTTRWAIPAVSMALVACVLDYALGGSGFQQWALPYPYATRLVDSWWLIEVAGVSAWWLAVGSCIRQVAAEARAGTPPTTHSEAVALWGRAIRAQTVVVVGVLAVVGFLHIGQGGGGWIAVELPSLPMYLLFLSVLLSPAFHWWSVRRIATQSADHEPLQRRAGQLEATVRVFALPATIAGFLATAATLALIPLTDSPWQYVEDFDADLTFTAIMVVVVVIEMLTALAWRRRALTHRTTVELGGPSQDGDHADEAFVTSPR